jgi:hypothetical protein
MYVKPHQRSLKLFFVLRWIKWRKLYMETYEFDAVIKKHDGIDAAYIEFPYNVEEEFGVKGQVKVSATFDGYEYRGSLAKMGHPCHCLGITKKIREEIKKHFGDSVHIVIVKDDAPRTVEAPEDFKKQLDQNEEAKTIFKDLSYTNQKQFIAWITSAKREETREKRVKDSISMLVRGIKHPEKEI